MNALAEWGSALLLGLVGSLHCAGMCGPLALAVPVPGPSRCALWISRGLYNLGRVGTYVALGAAFGLAGRTVALAGLQEWISLAAGAAILVGLILSRAMPIGTPVGRVVGQLKAGLGALLRRRSASALVGLGLLNGLLPCGLVYVACAGAAATGGVGSGAGYMFAFGLGTVPVMLGLGLARRALPAGWHPWLRRAVPVCVALVGLLLIVRGLGLGLPYLSPHLAPSSGAVTCH
ncbi:MAG TPA: sulfite exporter TauE/SafE family protein [Methylomirabilota bacterium]|nr:sulfite exporter TauE/SafE family protein [Methylomirabilota bacterium]